MLTRQSDFLFFLNYLLSYLRHFFFYFRQYTTLASTPYHRVALTTSGHLEAEVAELAPTEGQEEAEVVVVIILVPGEDGACRLEVAVEMNEQDEI